MTPVGGFKTTYQVLTLPQVGTGCNGLSNTEIKQLTDAGFTKSVCPFGILMVGTN